MLSAPSPEEPPQPKPKGRPTDFKPEYVAQAEKLCRLGATDIELADFFDCDVRSIYRWAQTHDAFCQALRAGKEACDDRVERCLYNRAIGYTHEAVKIFMPANAAAPVYAPYREHVPPDVGAAKMWLSNRRGEAWRDKQEHIHRFKPEQMTDDDLAAIAARGSEGTAEAPPHPGKPH
ncbi:MAG TPA: helix-turn-helix domain-containing protein [Verrucomicrobiae bacterium]|nr:helix-turn-helix domain-containing protein [Verrucomicrobiae bacterium]